MKVIPTAPTTELVRSIVNQGDPEIMRQALIELCFVYHRDESILELSTDRPGKTRVYHRPEYEDLLRRRGARLVNSNVTTRQDIENGDSLSYNSNNELIGSWNWENYEGVIEA